MFRFTYEIAVLVGGPLMVTVIAAGLKEADVKVYSVLGGTPRDVLGQPAQVRLTSIVECEGEADDA